MVRIWTLSGEELPILPEEQLGNVRSLKQVLHCQHGCPPRFQQVLLHHGSPLDDCGTLEPFMDMQLLLLPCRAASQNHADDLVSAASSGSVKDVEAILSRPQSPDLRNRSGHTALARASRHGHFEVVRLLLEAKAAPDLQQSDGGTALMGASQNGHSEVLRLLLEARAGKDFMNTFGATALMMACYHGHVGVARLLLEAGADKDVANSRGTTALTLAARRGHMRITSLLSEPKKCQAKIRV
ncbi:Dapk1 [Symbiodinium microadriaticum]|nr:Dapk1 [Symbiodinium microadriaticum]